MSTLIAFSALIGKIEATRAPDDFRLIIDGTTVFAGVGIVGFAHSRLNRNCKRLKALGIVYAARLGRGK